MTLVVYLESCSIKNTVLNGLPRIGVCGIEMVSTWQPQSTWKLRTHFMSSQLFLFSSFPGPSSPVLVWSIWHIPRRHKPQRYSCRTFNSCVQDRQSVLSSVIILQLCSFWGIFVLTRLIFSNAFSTCDVMLRVWRVILSLRLGRFQSLFSIWCQMANSCDNCSRLHEGL